MAVTKEELMKRFEFWWSHQMCLSIYKLTVATRAELWFARAWCEVEKIFSREYNSCGVAGSCLFGMRLTSMAVLVWCGVRDGLMQGCLQYWFEIMEIILSPRW